MKGSITKTKVLKAVSVLAILSTVAFMANVSLESLSLRKELIKQQQEMVKIQTEMNDIKKSQEEFLKTAKELQDSMQNNQSVIDDFAKRLQSIQNLLGVPAGNF